MDHILNPGTPFAVLKALIDLPAECPPLIDIHKTDQGCNGLHAAVVSVDLTERKNKIELLLRKGVQWATYDKSDNCGTPLHILLANEDFETALFFIACLRKYQPWNIAGYVIRDSEGKTPFILAAKVLSLACVQAMLEHDAISIHFFDDNTMSAFDYACILGQDLIVRQLMHYGCRFLANYSAPSRETVATVLLSIQIEPERDENACRNTLLGKNNMAFNFSLESRGKFPAYARLIQVQVNGQKKLWLLACKQNEWILQKNTGYSFTFHQDSESMSAFNEQLRQMSGKTILDACLHGHRKIETLFKTRTAHQFAIQHFKHKG
jgi:hypothetical protein